MPPAPMLPPVSQLSFVSNHGNVVHVYFFLSGSVYKDILIEIGLYDVCVSCDIKMVNEL